MAVVQPQQQQQLWCSSDFEEVAAVELVQAVAVASASGKPLLCCVVLCCVVFRIGGVCDFALCD